MAWKINDALVLVPTRRNFSGHSAGFHHKLELNPAILINLQQIVIHPCSVQLELGIRSRWVTYSANANEIVSLQASSKTVIVLLYLAKALEAGGMIDLVLLTTCLHGTPWPRLLTTFHHGSPEPCHTRLRSTSYATVFTNQRFHEYRERRYSLRNHGCGMCARYTMTMTTFHWRCVQQQSIIWSCGREWW